MDAAIVAEYPSRRTSAHVMLLPVSGHGHATVLIEVVVEPVPVRVPPLAVLIAIRDVAVAVLVHYDYAKNHLRHRPLNTLGTVSNAGYQYF